MAELQHKVKNALDEVRILVLGSQVLLGFQFRAFFEQGFDRLPPGDRACELGGLAALLLTLALLFLAPARHRIVEKGFDSERFHRFVMSLMRFALLPFAVALTLDLGVAGDRILGPAGGAACAAATFAAAMGFWYVHFAHRSRKRRGQPEEKMERTPLEHRIVQVLTEARVVLPGAQALLGFQLAMVLMSPFDELPESVKLVHLGSLACIALATIVLMAPAAYHRIVERGEDSERFHTFASRMVLLALALLAPGFAGDLFVVLYRAGYHRGALLFSIVALLCFYSAWFGATLLMLRRRARSTPRNAGDHRAPRGGTPTAARG
jgi:hypothetical protein